MAFTLEDTRILIAGETTTGHFDHPKYSVSPVMIETEKDQYECLGTCFFITESGIFITAKHVLEDVFPEKGDIEEYRNYLDEELDPTKAVSTSRRALVPQLLPGNQVLFRNIIWSVFHSEDDVTIGVVERKNNTRGERINTIPLVLSARDSKVGDSLFTFSYPETQKQGSNSFDAHPELSIGSVDEHYPNGRDRVMLPNPCYQTSINTKGGSSGGPVFNMFGAVVGINTSGIDESIHYVSKIENILDMSVPDGSIEKMITIRKLVEIGKVGVYIWDSQGNTKTNVHYEYKTLVPNIQ